MPDTYVITLPQSGNHILDIRPVMLLTEEERKAEDFLICLMGDAALNAESANSFQSIYSNIEQTIASNRISISGVDADEEAASMINYQNAYNLSSKMISVLCEVYDKLIQETGV